MGKVAEILIGGVGVVSSIPSGGNFILLILKPHDVNFVQKCQKMPTLCHCEKLE